MFLTFIVFATVLAGVLAVAARSSAVTMGAAATAAVGGLILAGEMFLYGRIAATVTCLAGVAFMTGYALAEAWEVSRAERERAAAPVVVPHAVPVRAGMAGRTLTVERLTFLTPGVAQIPFTRGRLAVVQRLDGEFVATRCVARPEESATAMETLAQTLTAREDVEFIGGAR